MSRSLTRMTPDMVRLIPYPGQQVITHIGIKSIRPGVALLVFSWAVVAFSKTDQTARLFRYIVVEWLKSITKHFDLRKRRVVGVRHLIVFKNFFYFIRIERFLEDQDLKRRRAMDQVVTLLPQLESLIKAAS